jgi:hypothetical protein
VLLTKNAQNYLFSLRKMCLEQSSFIKQMSQAGTIKFYQAKEPRFLTQKSRDFSRKKREMSGKKWREMRDENSRP